MYASQLQLHWISVTQLNLKFRDFLNIASFSERWTKNCRACRFAKCLRANMDPAGNFVFFSWNILNCKGVACLRHFNSSGKMSLFCLPPPFTWVLSLSLFLFLSLSLSLKFYPGNFKDEIKNSFFPAVGSGQRAAKAAEGQLCVVQHRTKQRSERLTDSILITYHFSLIDCWLILQIIPNRGHFPPKFPTVKNFRQRLEND